MKERKISAAAATLGQTNHIQASYFSSLPLVAFCCQS